MEQFQVPQFIDVEDKLFGPFTIKQFVYVAGGGGLIYLYLQLLPTAIAVILALPTGGLALALAFKKINGLSFIRIMQAFIAYLFANKMFFWSNQSRTPTTIADTGPDKASSPSTIKQNRNNNLDNLSWKLNVLDENK